MSPSKGAGWIGQGEGNKLEGQELGTGRKGRR